MRQLYSHQIPGIKGKSCNQELVNVTYVNFQERVLLGGMVNYQGLGLRVELLESRSWGKEWDEKNENKVQGMTDRPICLVCAVLW